MNQTSAPTSFRAFTLIELMISIAIVVVLMVGITKVFSLTANTAGATNTIGSAIRDGRAAQTMFYNDLGNTASDMPFMILRCGTQPAFRNKADQLSDRDYQSTDSVANQDKEILTTDLNGNNVEGESGVPGEIINPATVNNRNHRTDVFSFFARGLFARQTGNPTKSSVPFSPDSNGVYLSSITSNEAWIWYGHLRLANNNATPAYFDPGDTSAETATNKNDNNKYASDWTLGRFVNVMKSTTGRITDPLSGHLQFHDTQTFGQQFGYSSGTYSVAGANTADYTPFSYKSSVTLDGVTPAQNSAGALITTRSGRFDLLGASIDQMSQQVSNYLTWLSTNDPNRIWWTSLMTGDQTNPANVVSRTTRFQAQTYVNGINSDNLAYTAPLFVQHCSQFIVEYAGDYLNQDPTTGQVLNDYSDGATDGQIDYVFNPTTLQRSIRWYGLPRDIDGDGHIAGTVPATMTQSPDVVPLRDLWVTATAITDTKNPKGAPFERSLTILTPPSLAATTANYDLPSNGSGMQTPNYYECIWSPSDPKPKLIRITMTIDDPSGKLPDGQTFQYVIALH